MLIYSLATLGTKFSKLLLKFHGVLYNRGSVSEIVNRDSGFIINYLDQMSDAIDQIDSIDPYKCREYTLNNFDISVCAKNYIKQYERVVSTT
ncbi:hypothetical protein fh0823_02040 [Francisella halioticida]|uniref:Uncharacterized protein n=1 Tax=Francisella halioticida TaxID=549298 RepID=A0ABN5B188_9GAMM|nr:hypothetical protein [Francisella halioticida]ASG67555.1 hypothetical protein CDV26_03335 [Francisella halioticida]BCD90065.1 hypothetical protein fh0823_02040 [Francisella halioticida]